MEDTHDTHTGKTMLEFSAAIDGIEDTTKDRFTIAFQEFKPHKRIL